MSEVLNTTRKKVALVAKAAAVGAVLINPMPAHAKKSPAQRAADQLQQRIANNKPVHHDANTNVAWSKRSPRGFRLSYITNNPAFDTVRGERRYFEVKNLGDSLEDVRVRPLPKDVTPIQTKYDGMFNCGEQPTNYSVVALHGLHNTPFVNVRIGENKPFSLNIGVTRPAPKASVEVPPAFSPDPACGPAL